MIDESRYTCAHPLRLVVSGDSGALTVWTFARIQVQIGNVVANESVTGAELAQLLGVDSLKSGQSRQVELRVGIVFDPPDILPPLPHTVTFNMEYLTGVAPPRTGEVRTATTVLKCREPQWGELRVTGGDSTRASPPDNMRLTVFSPRLGSTFFKISGSSAGVFHTQIVPFDTLVMFTQQPSYATRRDTVGFHGQPLHWNIVRRAPELTGFSYMQDGTGATAIIEWMNPGGASGLPDAPIVHEAGDIPCQTVLQIPPLQVTTVDSFRRRYEYRTRTCTGAMGLPIINANLDSTRYSCVSLFAPVNQCFEEQLPFAPVSLARTRGPSVAFSPKPRVVLAVERGGLGLFLTSSGRPLRLPAASAPK